MGRARLAAAVLLLSALILVPFSVTAETGSSELEYKLGIICHEDIFWTQFSRNMPEEVRWRYISAVDAQYNNLKHETEIWVEKSLLDGPLAAACKQLLAEGKKIVVFGPDLGESEVADILGIRHEFNWTHGEFQSQENSSDSRETMVIGFRAGDYSAGVWETTAGIAHEYSKENVFKLLQGLLKVDLFIQQKRDHSPSGVLELRELGEIATPVKYFSYLSIHPENTCSYHSFGLFRIIAYGLDRYVLVQGTRFPGKEWVQGSNFRVARYEQNLKVTGASAGFRRVFPRSQRVWPWGEAALAVSEYNPGGSQYISLTEGGKQVSWQVKPFLFPWMGPPFTFISQSEFYHPGGNLVPIMASSEAEIHLPGTRWRINFVDRLW